MPVVGIYLASASLLLVAGGQKLVDPSPLLRALLSMRLHTPRGLVRVGAAFEVLLGLAALVLDSPWVALGVAGSYAAFTAFVVLGLARGGVLASCGCFGKADVPPTRLHAVVTGSFALVALSVAGLGASGDARTVPLLVAAAAVSVTAYAVMAVLPLVQAR